MAGTVAAGKGGGMLIGATTGFAGVADCEAGDGLIAAVAVDEGLGSVGFGLGSLVGGAVARLPAALLPIFCVVVVVVDISSGFRLVPDDDGGDFAVSIVIAFVTTDGFCRTTFAGLGAVDAVA